MARILDESRHYFSLLIKILIKVFTSGSIPKWISKLEKMPIRGTGKGSRKKFQLLNFKFIFFRNYQERNENYFKKKKTKKSRFLPINFYPPKRTQWKIF